MGKKILIAVTKPDLGGTSRYVLELVKKIPENYEPYFLMGYEGYLSDELAKLGYKENTYFISMTNSIFDLKQHLKSNFQAIKLIKRIKPDLIHCNCTTAGIVGRVCGFLTKVPVIFTAHGWAFTDGISRGKQLFYKLLETLLAAITKQIICVSEYDRQIALKVFPFFKKKLVTILNGIGDIDEYQPKQFESTPLKIVMMSRFCPQKDPYTLINAVNELYKEGLVVKLNIYGYGEQKENVLEEIASCSNPNIQFCGVAENIPEILGQNDIYALISNWEGLPIGIIEGMRSGMPILACNVGGNSELVQDGENGFLIERQNKEQLKERLKFLVQNSEYLPKFAGNSRAFYEKYFTGDLMSEKTISLYGQILKR